MKLPKEQIIATLREGSIEMKGEFLWGSNYTFLVQITVESVTFPAVYKPTRGERPLWDFPTASLARREAAAYLVSELIGWELVPPTVYRKKGPLGPGSLQVFIEHDAEYHYFNFAREDRQRLRPIVLFDCLINNADRKGSHVLKDTNGCLWLIDHGVCFHVEDKLRTVIWDFAGEPIPENLLKNLEVFNDVLGASNDRTSSNHRLDEYISRVEVKALQMRAQELIASRIFPFPDPSRRPYPWPQI